MKALNCKSGLIFLALLIAGSSLFAQKVEKDLHKEFKTNKSSVLSMDLKFCDFNAETWNKNQAVFDVLITVEHNEKAKAKKILDMIKVVIDQDGNDISVDVKMDKKFSNTNWGKSKKIKIQIDAKIPAHINFELENNFGSVTVTELTGVVSIENNFGSLAIDRLLGTEIDLELNYGSARFTELADASVELNYGSIDIKTAANLDLELNNGKCNIGSLNNIDAEINMGSLELGKVAATFKLISIENNMGSVEVGIDRDAGFLFTGEMQMGSLEYPKLDNLVKSKSKMNLSVKGTYGDGRSLVNVEGNMGSIEIRLK
ncbi:MAG: hypothetical protein U9N86_14825 [Bacteroidota bacterium]|nr:hypothetical protein [Bacteroidota bacterium]